MKQTYSSFLYRLAALTVAAAFSLAWLPAGATGRISVTDRHVHRAGENLNVTFDMVLDSLKLKKTHQLYITPVVEDTKGNSVSLPSILVNGRDMHLGYLRGTMPRTPGDHTVADEIERKNGKQQSYAYHASTPLSSWMMGEDATVKIVIDSCGCGNAFGEKTDLNWQLDLNPGKFMRLSYIAPAVTELPVSVHEGRARVQFEVDKTELHVAPYTCRNGQRIDNRAQIKIIEDSVKYALSDPDVEIASIKICGYASPESPYLHNEYLAIYRSKALSEYLGNKFNLPRDKCAYDAVAENWGEFREIVLKASDITETQRKNLLELIDSPAVTPADYDQKEMQLKEAARFAALYKSKILPQWFPKLRATKFEINTRLKPMSDQELAKILERSPEMMSLNQMFRVANLYPEGSGEFNRVIEIAVKYYPDDETANLNLAVAAINAGEIGKAREALAKAGNSPEAENARGVLAVRSGDFGLGEECFSKAGSLPEAMRNKALLLGE